MLPLLEEKKNPKIAELYSKAVGRPNQWHSRPDQYHSTPTADTSILPYTGQGGKEKGTKKIPPQTGHIQRQSQRRGVVVGGQCLDSTSTAEMRNENRSAVISLRGGARCPALPFKTSPLLMSVL